LIDRVPVGGSLTAAQVAELLHRDQDALALDRALRFLANRPRSEREIRDRLQSKGLAEEPIRKALARLRELGLVDDEQFARYWIEQRQQHRPRGERQLRLELRQKGVDSTTTAAAIETASTEEPVDLAYRAVLRRARALAGLEPREFTQRVGQFLLRRGFDYETTRSVVQRLRRELRIGSEDIDAV
jgi:regulatory protein